MVKVKIDTSGFVNRLNKIEKKLDNLPWDGAAQIVQKSVMHNFEIGGRYSKPNDPKGGAKKWQPRKDNASHKILKDSGALQAATYMEVHKDGFAIGNRLKYQAVHNFGYPPMNIPARPYLVYQEEDIKQIKKSFIKHIKS